MPTVTLAGYRTVYLDPVSTGQFSVENPSTATTIEVYTGVNADPASWAQGSGVTQAINPNTTSIIFTPNGQTGVRSFSDHDMQITY